MKIATSATDPTICTWPFLFVQMSVCIKRRNKKCATFIIKKGIKIICIIFYHILKHIVCSVFFSTVNKSKLWLHDYLFANITQRKSVFFVAYSKLCVRAVCVLVFNWLFKPGTSERAILLCSLYPHPSVSDWLACLCESSCVQM